MSSGCVERAANSEPGFLEHVGVEHRGGDVFMPEELLDGANVVAVFEQVRGETVSEGVAAGGLSQPGGANGELDGVLQVLLGKVMAARFSAAGIGGDFARGEDVLPRPGAGRTRIFAVERIRQVDGAVAVGKILPVKFADTREMGAQRRAEAIGEKGDARPVALAVLDVNAAVGEIDVFTPLDIFEAAFGGNACPTQS